MSDDVLAELGQATQAYQAAVEDFDREAARLLGVNGTDQRCLELLITAGELTPRELARQLNLTTGSVTVMLDRLEKLDLLARAPHPTDRRKVTVRVTECGARRALDLMTPLIEEGGREVAAKYSAEQLALVVDFLRTVTDIQRRHVDRLRDQPSPPGRKQR
ncbi:MarR family winged helix-turn-helix transcriptional regulator [Kutzneria sp. CA-103260]|uniref:MarR family winged helix-turn-helix transcriptional regulator n=1 Tax=Kutzneria sp. CA-103260 TaxID=2802641 RepID=UPI001BA8895E|nr:MarR family transcriptional regulator [Kutzneria sp. CA-103260]QUQ62954.1 MarR family protein [Kutzneria sp. CA-103260]